MKRKITYNSRNVYKNSFLSVLYKGIGMALSFISAPMVLKCLGEEKYGILTSLLSVVSWIYYLDLGIGNGLRIRLSESLAKENYGDAKKYINVAYYILSYISIIALLIAIVIILSTNIEQFINVPQGFDESVNLILIVSLLFVSINFILSLVNNIFYAVQNASAVSALSIIGQLIYVIGLFAYAQTGNNLIIVVASIEGMGQLLRNIIGSIWAYIKYPECRITIEKPDLKYKNGVLSFGIKTFIINISSLLLNTTDNILILQYFGASSVTPYNFCYKYFGIISSVFAAVVIPLQSAYTMAYTKNDKKWIVQNLKRALMILGAFSVGTIIAALIFRPFSFLWLQKELVYSNGLILYTGIYCVLLMISHVFSTFVGGVGRIKEATIVGVAQAIVNIPASIFFAVILKMGIEGIILGSVSSMALSAIVGPIVSVDIIRKMR